MFVREEVVVGLEFAEARSRLARLALGDWLTGASAGAYEEGVVKLLRVGPLGSRPGMSKLVGVQARDLVIRDGAAILTLRWEATGAGGGLFPALDADITLSAIDDKESRLTLDGAYRPPFGTVGRSLDRAVLNRVAAATVRSLLGQIGEALCGPEKR